MLLGFLHTSPAHVGTFRALVAAADPSVPTVEVVDESLLADARTGEAGVAGRIRTRMLELIDAGATSVVCTCSTIAGIAEQIGTDLDVRVRRVDRAMVERAVAIAGQASGRVAVVAALDATITPTARFIADVAEASRTDIDVSTHLVDGAWSEFESGEVRRYHELIAAAIVTLDADVIVLAQASMAGATELVDSSVEVLSSPALAVADALANV